MNAPGYAEIMRKPSAHLTLKLDTAQPVELGNFVGAFTSLRMSVSVSLRQSTQLRKLTHACMCEKCAVVA